MRKRRLFAATTAAKRLAISVGVVLALSVFGIVPAVRSVAHAATGTLSVEDRSHDNDNPDNQLYAHFQIFNSGTSAVSLSSLTMRYWFTNETPSDPLVFECDYALVTCANLTAKFVVLATPIAGKANTYLQLGFTGAAGSVAPGGASSGEIQIRIHHANWSNFITTESYSFISDESFVYKATQTVTLYQNGSLVWGVEPS